ncbi:MerR family transcriptional regulator [Clostridium tagluense]|uniref:MerR family transcriptional regulator n=1 Tax=Clostridium tagluense TaxID=360422 RepID=UPI001CF1796C|nr:MerR family transcriptional regulator [Clostridium tagluense]MCB2313777.1 MerR family transcriptional regulator [Clostridium tagluense]MCB2318594.1 MerR family transcriptional regulator [Clostridium tagluense]MCB2323440.1 MerR family transcriptional regulator [Clostridium tagluense]MCB2328267.1 MerR family transcriptional regulator [Clostridium tagluense]MCB2333076.1 MerR family transcriptional regulator [Clostridium tagluense]
MIISQLASKLQISPHTLRYYEKIELIRNVKRDEIGNRVYSEEDLNWIKFLLRLKKIKMPIEKIKVYAELRYIGDTTVKNRSAMLQEQKEKLLDQINEIKESVEFLDNKMEIYIKMEERINE